MKNIESEAFFRRFHLDLFCIVAIVLLQQLTLYTQNSAPVSYGALVVLVISLVGKRSNLFAISLLYFLTYFVGPRAIPAPAYQIPGFAYLLPVALTLAVVFMQKKSAPRHWFRKSKVDRLSLLLMMGTIVFSTLALIAWAFWSKQNGAFSDTLNGLSKFSPWITLSIIVPTLSMINALAEETFFRGILQDSLALCCPQKLIILTVQAASFAAIHYAGGFPNGKSGYLMTFVYGLSLGFLRMRTGTLRMSWFTHVLADMTILYLVLRFF